MRVKRRLRATAPRLNALRYDDSAASSARRSGPPGRSASRDDNSAVSFADSAAAWPFRGVKVHAAATAEMMSARRNIADSIVDPRRFRIHIRLDHVPRTVRFLRSKSALFAVERGHVRGWI